MSNLLTSLTILMPTYAITTKTKAVQRRLLYNSPLKFAKIKGAYFFVCKTNAHKVRVSRGFLPIFDFYRTTTILYKQLWGNEELYNFRRLDVYISTLRKYLRTESNVKFVSVTRLFT